MEANTHASRTHLETLSTGELIKLADSNGIDIPHGLERIFIIEELLDYYSTSEEETGEEIQIDPSIPETAALPKQYNFSFIEVLIRDPLWIFAYWEIKGQDREMYENSGDFKGYCLRVVPLNEDDTEDKEKSFTVPVEKEDCARYLGFAEQSQGRYIVKVGVMLGASEVQIAASAPFYIPHLIEKENILAMTDKPLVRLSGVQDLLIIKSAERQHKIKRQ